MWSPHSLFFCHAGISRSTSSPRGDSIHEPLEPATRVSFQLSSKEGADEKQGQSFRHEVGREEGSYMTTPFSHQLNWWVLEDPIKWEHVPAWMCQLDFCQRNSHSETCPYEASNVEIIITFNINDCMLKLDMGDTKRFVLSVLYCRSFDDRGWNDSIQKKPTDGSWLEGVRVHNMG